MAQRFSGILVDICEIIGPELTEKFGAAFGGNKLYIPSLGRLKPDHPIVAVIGYDAACALADNLVSSRTGAEFEIPIGQFSAYTKARFQMRARVAEGIQQGMSVPEIARYCGITDRAVRMQKRRLREALERQQKRLGRPLSQREAFDD